MPTSGSGTETERERHLHAMYDAWKDLEFTAEVHDNKHYGMVARAILRGQLVAAGYPPFTRSLSQSKTPESEG